MRGIRFLISICFLFISIQIVKSEIIVLSKCDDKQDEFLKNEYVLNLDKLFMTRNYIYKEKTYQKYKITDLSVKKLRNLKKKVNFFYFSWRNFFFYLQIYY